MPVGAVRSRRVELAGLIAAWIALVWLVALVVQGKTARFDFEARRAVQDIASPGLTKLMEAITWLGSEPVVIGIAVGVALICHLTGRPDRALLMIIAMAGGGLLLGILKIQFHRPRPEPFFGLSLSEAYSFPSGHALLSSCCYGAIASFVRWPARIAAAMLILLIGFSRIYLGVHYATDVIAGYLIAIVWMAGVALIHARFERARR